MRRTQSMIYRYLKINITKHPGFHSIKIPIYTFLQWLMLNYISEAGDGNCLVQFIPFKIYMCHIRCD